MASAIVFTPSSVIQDGQNNKLVFKFPGSVKLDNHSVAVSALSMYYSWRNITAALGNNTFSITIFPGTYPQTFTCVFPDGSYTISDINSYFQYFCIQSGLYLIDATGKNVFFATFTTNKTKYAIEIQTFSVNPMNPPLGYTRPINFPAPVIPVQDPRDPPIPAIIYNPWNAVLSFPSGFNKIIGYTAGFATDANLDVQTTGVTPNGGYASGATIAYLSSVAPQIQPNPVVLVSCTGVSNKYSLAPVIYSFTSGGASVGALISERPSSLDYISMIPGVYSELKLTLMGADFLPLAIQDGNISIMLSIRENV